MRLVLALAAKNGFEASVRLTAGVTLHDVHKFDWLNQLKALTAGAQHFVLGLLCDTAQNECFEREISARGNK